MIKFKQSYWLKPYIDYNTAWRVFATSSSEKYCYKLMNCAVFCKTLQNQRKYTNHKLVSDHRTLEKIVSKHNFKTTIIINENLELVSMHKTSIL